MDFMTQTGFGAFIGTSPAMQSIYTIIESAASSRAGVFITGASGTGKDVAAQALHKCSPRARHPFIALNCAAIPRDLLESELFGHVKGAYTGATETRDGAATRAHSGTLFLDEICDMPMEMQGKLLRFLQDGHFTKIGGNKLEHSDVRIVCATNKDPHQQIALGRFREDLYYRLHVIPLHMPPLRLRGHDITELAEVFLHRQSMQEKKNFTAFDPGALARLRHYDWPGNVRELINLIHQAVVLHTGPLLCEDMLPAHIREPAPLSEVDTPLFLKPLHIIEKQVIEQAINRCDGNIIRAAALLEISPSTIYRKKAEWEGAVNL